MLLDPSIEISLSRTSAFVLSKFCELKIKRDSFVDSEDRNTIEPSDYNKLPKESLLRAIFDNLSTGS